MAPVRIDIEFTAESLSRVLKLFGDKGGKVEAVERLPGGRVYAQGHVRWEDLPELLLGLACILEEPLELPIVEDGMVHTAFINKAGNGVPVGLVMRYKTPFTPESIAFYLPLDAWEEGDLERLFREILPMMPEFERVGDLSVQGNGYLRITGSVEVREGYVLRGMRISKLELDVEAVVRSYVEINFCRLVLTSEDKKAYILHFKPYSDAYDWNKGA